jgi:drug/metabolite transporter (DMT)-like permease
MSDSTISLPRPDAGRADPAALRSAFGGMVISGLGPLLVRHSPVDAASTAFWRMLVGAPVALWLARREPPLPRGARAWALLGGLLLGADLVVWNRSVLTTTILEATLLVMVYPVLVAVGGWLLWRERVTARLALGGAVAFAGLAAMTLGPVSGQSSVEGNLYALLAAVFYTGCLLITGRLCRVHSTVAVTAWTFVGASLGALPVALFEARFVPAETGGWAYLAMYGGVTLLGYLLINRSLRRLPTNLVAVLGYGLPVVATLLAVPLMGEIPGLGDLAGAAIVVTGLTLATRPGKAAA